MRNYFYIFFGGGIGASARYWLAGAFHRYLPADFPYGTLFVNIAGCFTIGVLMTLLEERFLATPSLRLFLVIGLLGGFTTFSSFSYETIALIRDAEFFRASVNVALSLLGCLCATTIGMIVGRLV